MHQGFWSFLEKYGYRYGGDHTRALLPCEVWVLLVFIVILLHELASLLSLPPPTTHHHHTHLLCVTVYDFMFFIFEAIHI
jgi:hypothetical protein